MNLAYLILCHKNFEQVVLLINSLNLSKNDHVILHVDAKNLQLKMKLERHYACSKYVSIVQNPISVHWSGISQVYATIKMIRYVYESSIMFDYISLLSGEDIVLDVSLFKRYLFEAKKKSFIEFRNDRANYLWRINKFNLFRDNKYSQKKIVRILSSVIIRLQRLLCIRRWNFTEDEIYLGSQWFTINKKHMDVIIKKINSHFLKKFSFTSCSDEHFFQILFKKYIPDDEYETFNLRYISFSSGKSSPDYLTINDLVSVRVQPRFFIARKVSSNTMLQYFDTYSEK